MLPRIFQIIVSSDTISCVSSSMCAHPQSCCCWPHRPAFVLTALQQRKRFCYLTQCNARLLCSFPRLPQPSSVPYQNGYHPAEARYMSRIRRLQVPSNGLLCYAHWLLRCRDAATKQAQNNDIRLQCSALRLKSLKLDSSLHRSWLAEDCLTAVAPAADQQAPQNLACHQSALTIDTAAPWLRFHRKKSKHPFLSPAGV